MVDLPQQKSAGAVLRSLPLTTAGLGRWIADFLLPPQCACCGEAIEKTGALCAECWQQIDFIEKPCCDILGVPFAYDLETGENQGILSTAAIAAPPRYARARAVARFDRMARRLVHNLKYRDALECAPLMGRWMARAAFELVAQSDIIIPVPLYRLRLWLRRSNQAALLAGEIGRQSGLPVFETMLERIRSTRSQVGLNLEERQRNVAGAFVAQPNLLERLAGRDVVIVDDVISTGSTVNALTKVLLGAGVDRVDVISFSRVVIGIDDSL